MINLEPVPFLMIILLLLTAGLIWLTFRLIRSFVLPLVQGRQKQHRWERNALRVELLIWTLFFAISLYLFLQTAPLVTLVFLTVLLVLGWYWWRDFFQGLLFRQEYEAEPGDFLIYEGRQYVIESIRGRHLKLRSNEGGHLLLPYRLLREVYLSKAAQKTALIPFSFQLDTTASQPRIEKLLAESPWSAPARLPQVQPIKENTYRITTFAPSEEIKDKQERYLKERLES